MKSVFVILLFGTKDYTEQSAQFVHLVELEPATYCQLNPSMITLYQFVEKEEFKALNVLNQCLGYKARI